MIVANRMGFKTQLALVYSMLVPIAAAGIWVVNQPASKQPALLWIWLLCSTLLAIVVQVALPAVRRRIFSFYVGVWGWMRGKRRDWPRF